MEGRVGVALEASLSPVSGWPTACATISCDYCKAVLSFQGLPAVRWDHPVPLSLLKGFSLIFSRYADHLSNEHRILFQQVPCILWEPTLIAMLFLG